MSILDKLFKVSAARMPRVRGLGSSFYFGHPFLDAWELRVTTAVEGAGAHCQLDNFPLARQIVFDWIEDRMRERTPSRRGGRHGV